MLIYGSPDVFPTADAYGIRDVVSGRVQYCGYVCNLDPVKDGTQVRARLGRLKHVLIDAGELALLDLDGLCMGHPAYDLGNFVSSLYYLEQQERFDAAARHAYAREFLRGYAEASRLRVAPAVLLWYVAARLLHKQAAKYLRHLHADRSDKASQMLALAEAALAGCRDVLTNASLIEAAQLLPDAELALRCR